MMTTPRVDRTKVFISYAHADKEWLDRLKVHLRPQERAGIVDTWDDSRIKTGQKWRDEITKALDAAKVAILLVSADFLASDFIDSDELPPILAAEEKEGLIVMPVIVGYCGFGDTPTLSQFQASNPPSRPMIDMGQGERDKLWSKLAKDVGEALSSHP